MTAGASQRSHGTIEDARTLTHVNATDRTD
jgi:hypothetical protein